MPHTYITFSCLLRAQLTDERERDGSRQHHARAKVQFERRVCVCEQSESQHPRPNGYLSVIQEIP